MGLCLSPAACLQGLRALQSHSHICQEPGDQLTSCSLWPGALLPRNSRWGVTWPRLGSRWPKEGPVMLSGSHTPLAQECPDHLCPQGSNVMEEQDLREIGISDPQHRRKLLQAARSLPKVITPKPGPAACCYHWTKRTHRARVPSSQEPSAEPAPHTAWAPPGSSEHLVRSLPGSGLSLSCTP